MLQVLCVLFDTFSTLEYIGTFSRQNIFCQIIHCKIPVSILLPTPSIEYCFTSIDTAMSLLCIMLVLSSSLCLSQVAVTQSITNQCSLLEVQYHDREAQHTLTTHKMRQRVCGLEEQVERECERGWSLEEELNAMREKHLTMMASHKQVSG